MCRFTDCCIAIIWPTLVRSELIFLTDPKALCIDGSKAAYHHEKGFGEGESKWFVFFEGGGWCFSHSSCYERASTDRGSTMIAPGRQLSDHDNYFSRNETKNGMFNWNMVFVIYCDGGSFSGNSNVVYNGTKLYYSGHNILLAFLKDLQRRIGVSQGTKEIIVSGSSAGGLSALIHIDKFQQFFPEAIISGLPDSAFFPALDETLCRDNYKHSMIRLIQFMNSSESLPHNCISPLNTSSNIKTGNDRTACIFAFNLLRSIQTPIFSLQSKYDIWNIKEAMCLSFRSQRKRIEDFGSKFALHYFDAFREASPLHGGVLDSSPRHATYDKNWMPYDHWNKLKFPVTPEGNQLVSSDGNTVAIDSKRKPTTSKTEQELFWIWYKHRIAYGNRYKNMSRVQQAKLVKRFTPAEGEGEGGLIVVEDAGVLQGRIYLQRNSHLDYFNFDFESASGEREK